MKYDEIKGLTTSEKYGKLYELKKERVALKMQLGMMQLNNVNLIKQRRRDIARVYTALNAVNKD